MKTITIMLLAIAGFLALHVILDRTRPRPNPGNAMALTFTSGSSGRTLSFEAPTGMTDTNPPRNHPTLIRIATGEGAGHMYWVHRLYFDAGAWRAECDRPLEALPTGTDTGYLSIWPQQPVPMIRYE